MLNIQFNAINCEVSTTVSTTYLNTIYLYNFILFLCNIHTFDRM